MKRRKFIVAVALYEREHGQAPTWSEVQRLPGIPQRNFKPIIRSLRKAGLVTYDLSPRSLRLAPEALALALGPRTPEEPRRR